MVLVVQFSMRASSGSISTAISMWFLLRRSVRRHSHGQYVLLSWLSWWSRIYIQSFAAYACILLYHDLGRLKHEQCRLINGIRWRSELDALSSTLSRLAKQFPNFFAKIYHLSARSIYCVPMYFVSMHDQTTVFPIQMHLLNRGFADCFIDDGNIQDQTNTSSQGPVNQDVTTDLNNHDVVLTADDTTLFWRIRWRRWLGW
jgi:hypothetical protein